MVIKNDSVEEGSVEYCSIVANEEKIEAEENL
jgi:hypothetical protein